jgi:ferredoxin
MPKVTFLPSETSIEVAEKTKLLVAGRKAKVPIRFGCASCRCGTCAVRLQGSKAELSPMKDDERELLSRMKLPVDGPIRLSCQARILAGEAVVDLDFQDEYSPDTGLNDME